MDAAPPLFDPANPDGMLPLPRRALPLCVPRRPRQCLQQQLLQGRPRRRRLGRWLPQWALPRVHMRYRQREMR